MPDTLNLTGWVVRAARLMVGIPDYDTYVEHRQRNHPDEPIMSYEPVGGSLRGDQSRS